RSGAGIRGPGLAGPAIRALGLDLGAVGHPARPATHPVGRTMLWTPRGFALGDVTIVRDGADYHLFSEERWLDRQAKFPGTRIVGHAVSRDLFRWEELPVALECGPAGSFDAHDIYHMDVFVHEGVWFMYYTGIDKPGPGQQQSIGLATSRDGLRWTKR